MSNNPPITKSLFHVWLTVKLLAKAEDAFTEPAIRNYIFYAEPRQTSKGIIPGNGLAPHIRRIGSKLVINHGGFLSWIEGGAHHVRPGPNGSIQSINLPSGKYGKQTAIAPEGKESAAKGEASQSDPFRPDVPEIDTQLNRKQRSRRQI